MYNAIERAIWGWIQSSICLNCIGGEMVRPCTDSSPDCVKLKIASPVRMQYQVVFVFGCEWDNMFECSRMSTSPLFQWASTIQIQRNIAISWKCKLLWPFDIGVNITHLELNRQHSLTQYAWNKTNNRATRTPLLNRGTRAPISVWYNNNLEYLTMMYSDEISQVQKMANEEVKWWRGLQFIR